MSNVAWCDLNKNNILRLHDYCRNSKGKFQKQITFTTKQYQFEDAGFKNTKKNSKDLKKSGTTSLNQD